MRLPLLLSLLLGLAAHQPLHAADPGAQQDAEDARQKLLRAADQIDNLQANAETTRASVEAMKADISRLEAQLAAVKSDNEALRQQLADLHTAMADSDAARAKERKALLDSVAEMIAANNKASGSSKPIRKKPASGDETPAPVKNPDSAHSTPPPPPESAASPDPGKQKGYYHVVASGETLTLICNAYKQNGVNVTVAEIEKANGLNEKSVLKIGQKLFIPKPGN